MSDQTDLTERQRAVITEIANGFSQKQAAHHLGISPRTFEVHAARAREALGARNAAHLVRIAMSRGLLPREND